MSFIGEKFDVDVYNYTDVKLEMFEDFEGLISREPVYRIGNALVFMSVLDKKSGWMRVYVSDLLDSKEMQALMSLYGRAVNYLNKEHKGGTVWHEKTISW